MARIPLKGTSLPKIGEAFAHAVENTEARRSFKSDPHAYLIAAGIDAGVLAGLKINVSEDDEDTLNLILPTRINSTRVANGDPDYMADLGKSVVLVCTYES